MADKPEVKRDAKGHFVKGTSKIGGSGRDKSTPNKKSVAVKEALEQAFDKLGGIEALVEFARKEPAEFYRLWVKMLPRDINADVTSNGESIAPTITSDEAVKMIRDFQVASAAGITK